MKAYEGKCLSFQPIDLNQKCVFEETPGVYEICEENARRNARKLTTTDVLRCNNNLKSNKL